MTLVDDFIIEGPNGSHQAAVFVLVGPNLDKWVKQVQGVGLPIEIVRVLLREFLRSLDFLHRKARIIHTDLKPDNLCLVIDHRYQRKLVHLHIYFVKLKYFTIKLRLADDAIKWQKIGNKPPHPSYISSVAKKHQKPFSSRRRRDKINHIRTTRKEIIELRKIEDELDSGMIIKFTIPLRFRKAGIVWRGGAQETHCATCHQLDWLLANQGVSQISQLFFDLFQNFLILRFQIFK